MIRKTIIVICLIVFALSGYHVAKYVFKNMSAENTLNEVAESHDRGLAEVYAENSDVVGWVTIKGTKVNYPVMQTPADPDHYLHTDFKEEPSDSGTPFVDASSVIAGATRLSDGSIASGSTWNWLVYGHHMKIGTMFADLLDFEKKDFWKEHRSFEFDRISFDGEGNISEVDEMYQIIAAGYSQIYPKDSDAFKYYRYTGYYDEKTFNEFIAGIKAESCYDTGLSAEYGDQLVTLSTCAYQTDNGRFYIVGKRVR